LESYFGITLSANPSNWLVITSFIDGSYVGNISVDGQVTTTGRKFREVIMNYNIRSAAFDIVYNGENFIITTYGYGHGVGMSQNGANILAKQGYTFDAILRYYYTGIIVA
jgi:stage II sporulation protein D